MLSQTVDEKMRKVVKYFADNNHQVSEIISRGRKQGITEKQSLSGMARVYERMEQGEVIKPLNMVWMAWEEAKKAKSKDVMNFMFNRDHLIVETKKAKKLVAIMFLICVFGVLGSWLIFFLYLEYYLGAKL